MTKVINEGHCWANVPFDPEESLWPEVRRLVLCEARVTCAVLNTLGEKHNKTPKTFSSLLQINEKWGGPCLAERWVWWFPPTIHRQILQSLSLVSESICPYTGTASKWFSRQHNLARNFGPVCSKTFYTTRHWLNSQLQVSTQTQVRPSGNLIEHVWPTGNQILVNWVLVDGPKTNH